MSVSISPIWNGQQFLDNLGNPLSGGCVFQYEAGSFSIEQATFTTNVGDVPNSNPIILDSSGRMPTELWLTDGVAYQLVLTQADQTTVLAAVDDIIGVTASTIVAAPSLIWNPSSGAPTYLTTSAFLLVGDQTSNFAVGNRVRLTVTGGYLYGTVTASAFSNPNTQVTLELDGANIDGSLSAAEYSIAVVNGRIIDAGAVDYSTSTLAYGTSGTVGNKLRSLETADATLNTRVDALRKVWATSGTDTYTITTSPAVTSYAADQVFTVRFVNANTGASTLNINGVGALSLGAYNSSGALVTPTIKAGQVSDVAYNGTQFVLLDRVPEVAASAAPRGMQAFTSNGDFIVPAGVSFIKVTVVGAGGSGASGIYDSNDGIYSFGGAGGAGGAAVGYIATTAGTSYPVNIGPGSAAAIGSAGSAGGTSAFGNTLLVATGGQPGVVTSQQSFGAGGAGGTGSGTAAQAVFTGNAGEGGRSGQTAGTTPYTGPPPLGGSSLLPSYGNGGNGGMTFLPVATAGANGFVMVEW